MSQPGFWKMSKCSPGCDPLLGSHVHHRRGPRPQFLLMSLSVVPSSRERGGHHVLHLRPGTERSWPASRHRHCCQRGSSPLSCTSRLRRSFRGLNHLLTRMGANPHIPSAQIMRMSMCHVSATWGQCEEQGVSQPLTSGCAGVIQTTRKG